MSDADDASRHKESAGQRLNLADVFETLIPFRFLPSERRERLIGQMTEREVEAETLIFERGERDEQSVYVALSGQFEVYDPLTQETIALIKPGRYFGERAALFDTPRTYSVRSTRRSQLASLEASAFLELVAEQPAFAHALGDKLREKTGSVSRL